MTEELHEPSQQGERSVPIKAAKPTPEEVKNKESWRDFALKAEQNSSARLEDAAKFIATMISISLTVFITNGSTLFTSFFGVTPYLVLTLILWLMSLFAAFFVIYPRTYRYSSHSTTDIIKMHGRVIRYKRALLIASIGLFFAALVLASFILSLQYTPYRL